MVVKEMRMNAGQAEHDNFMVVLFKINADTKPCKIVKLIKGAETQLVETTSTFTPQEYHTEE